MILQGLQAAITGAPQVVELVTKSKELIDAMFKAGLITKAQQDLAHQQADLWQEMALAGMLPVWWKVEPDPPTAAPA